MEMAKHVEAPKAETVEKVASVYKKTGSISETALQAEISTTKVRKILITEGLWSSPRSQQIRQLSDQGKSLSRDCRYIADQRGHGTELSAIREGAV
jgi:hypothetical protein